MAFSLTWLPDVLRDAGLRVSPVKGWETRGRGDVGEILGILCHHTGGSPRGNMSALDVLVHGRKAVPSKGIKALPGPLSQLGLGRDGTFFIIAAGRCNHAGSGHWKGCTDGNLSFIGIEAENTGGRDDFPWPEKQLEAYRFGVAAILRHIGKDEMACAGHKEYAPSRKQDPTFDMNAFRLSVRRILADPALRPKPVPAAEPDGKRRKTLRRGDDDPLVTELQRILGVVAPPDQATKFGPKTEAAVREFQRSREMVPDGIVGPRTWAALDALSVPAGVKPA